MVGVGAAGGLLAMTYRRGLLARPGASADPRIPGPSGKRCGGGVSEPGGFGDGTVRSSTDGWAAPSAGLVGLVIAIPFVSSSLVGVRMAAMRCTGRCRGFPGFLF